MSKYVEQYLDTGTTTMISTQDHVQICGAVFGHRDDHYDIYRGSCPNMWRSIWTQGRPLWYLHRIMSKYVAQYLDTGTTTMTPTQDHVQICGAVFGHRDDHYDTYTGSCPNMWRSIWTQGRPLWYLHRIMSKYGKLYLNTGTIVTSIQDRVINTWNYKKYCIFLITTNYS